MIDLNADIISSREEKFTNCPYRQLVAEVVDAIAEEGIDPELMAPKWRARYEAMLGSLADPHIPEAAFRRRVIELVQFIEYSFRGQVGKEGTERLYRCRPLLSVSQARARLGDTFAVVYLQATQQLQQDAIYPVIRPIGWHLSPKAFRDLAQRKLALADLRPGLFAALGIAPVPEQPGPQPSRRFESRSARVWRRIHEFPGEMAAEFCADIPADVGAQYRETLEKRRLLHQLERAY